MTYRFTILATLSLLTAFIATPAHVHGLQARLRRKRWNHTITTTPRPRMLKTRRLTRRAKP